jgi:hypothetical protein
MSFRQPAALLVIALTALEATSAIAFAAPPGPVVRAAERSVVATRVDNQLGTGFAFGSNTSVVTGTAGDGAQVATALGRFGDASALDERDGLALVGVPQNLRLVPLPIAPAQRSSRAFVIGSPLGYAGRKVRAVRLRSDKAARRGAVAGRLPAVFVGAPVVTSRGELIGAVSSVGRSSWTITPATALIRLDAKPQQDDAGVPLWAILAGGLLILVAALGSIAIVSRRRRATATATLAGPGPSAVRTRQAEPLVRRREPAPEVAIPTEAAAPGVERDDFEVLLREREP